MVSTDVHHYNDGTTSRDQMISGPTVADVLKMYEAIAQIDAGIAAGAELKRIAGIKC
jgi:hypothetical protein